MPRNQIFLASLVAFLQISLVVFGFGQTDQAPDNVTTLPLDLRQFRPKAQLVVPNTVLTSARFPVIDVHTHFRFRMREATPEDLGKYVAEILDRNRIAICVSLDATLGSEEDHLSALQERFPDRFAVFAHLDFQGDGTADNPATWACNRPSFGHEVAERLRVAKGKGVVGLKFFKQFGLEYRDGEGELLKINDPRFAPIWEACAQLELPVLIHTADPAAFFEPIDEANERLEELGRHPEWSFADSKFPRRESLARDLIDVVRRHRKTTFIAAHCLNYAEDLGTLGRWLDENPNLYVDIASRIGELGRQPYTARAFFDRFDNRILFGTDGPWPGERLGYYWRFLESFDEYFPYSEKQPPPQGLWNIYGLGLREDSLKKIYYGNALRLIPKLEEQYHRACEHLQENP